MARSGRQKSAFINVRMLPNDQREVARVARAVSARLPDVSRAVVIRAALRLGLEALERDPSLIVKPATVTAPAPPSAVASA